MKNISLLACGLFCASLGSACGSASDSALADGDFEPTHQALSASPDQPQGPETTAQSKLEQTAAANINDLMGLSNGNTHSNITPMGVHYEYAKSIVPSAAAMALLQNAGQQPPIVPSTSGQSWQHFSVRLFPYGSPIPADINQHAIGDCDFDSALASLAYQHPVFVSKLIHDNGNGTFAVSMYNPSGNPMTVQVDSQFMADNRGNIGQVSGKNGVANWATVLEKAAMKYITVYGTPGATHNGLNNDIGGMGSEHALPMFIGNGDSYAFGSGALTPDQFARVVRVSMANGLEVTGGFNQNAVAVGMDETVSGHGYAVMLPGANGAMVTMRNPWGVSPWAPNSGKSGYDQSNDGLLNIPSSPTWSQMVDLRIISSGAAVKVGRTTPYAPPAAHFKANVDEQINITEPHARR